MSDKPIEELSREELVKIVEAQRYFLDMAREKFDALIGDWSNLPDSERQDRLIRAFSALLINPWPLDDRTAAALRRFTEAAS